MAEYLDNNTTNREPTYFPRAVELIKQAKEEYPLCTENWIYPTRHKFGSPKDKYYAEVWYDGMDWNKNYWLIETENWNNPKAYALAHFTSYEELEKIPLPKSNYKGM